MMNKSIKDILHNIFLSKEMHINNKIDKLKKEILEGIELSRRELKNRKNGIEGESTIEQLEKVIIPDLEDILLKLDNKIIPKKRVDRYSLAYGNALKMWDWDMERATELYKKLTDIHHDYQDLL